MCSDMLDEVVGEIILDVVINEISKANEESWTTVKPRSKVKAQRQRTGLIMESNSEMSQQGKVVCIRTGYS